MTNEDYRRLRESMGMSQTELGRIVGRNSQTISRRERGMVPINPEAEFAILYLHTPLLADDDDGGEL